MWLKYVHVRNEVNETSTAEQKKRKGQFRRGSGERPLTDRASAQRHSPETPTVAPPATQPHLPAPTHSANPPEDLKTSRSASRVCHYCAHSYVNNLPISPGSSGPPLPHQPHPVLVPLTTNRIQTHMQMCLMKAHMYKCTDAVE